MDGRGELLDGLDDGLVVIVGASDGRAPVCPICRDGFLPDEPTAGCSVCGTAHHPECASLNGDRCSVFGCGGRCGGGGQAQAVFALVLHPGSPATAELADALGRWTGLDPYDARLRLRHPLPQVVAFLPRGRLDGAAAELARLGGSAFAVAPDQLLPEPPLVVRAVEERGPDWLTVRASRGARRRLELSPRRFAVRARITESLLRDPGKRQRREGKFFLPVPPRMTDADPVVHIYEPGGGPPVEFARSMVANYQFLGDGMSISATENFARLVDLLCDGVAASEALLPLHGESRASPDGAKTSDRAWVRAASRLLFLAHEAPRSRPPVKG